MKDALRIAVVGYGNIGRRHTDSLLALGVDNVVLVRRDPGAPRAEAHRHLECHGSLEAAAREPLDGVVVCTPTALHGAALELCFDLGVPVLSEKPIVDTWAKALRLVDRFRARPVPVVVGYDLRFTDALPAIKRILSSGDLGAPFLVQLEAGGYMPDWRPRLDYRDLYSARATLGGGVALDLVHEIDSMRYFFGDPASVLASIARVGSLEIETDDVASMVFEYSRGLMVVTVLDYLRRPFARSYRIVCEHGTLYWKEGVDEIKVWAAGGRAAETVWRREGGPESAFVREMAHFLDVVRGREPPRVDFWDGINSLGLVEAAKSASETGKRQATAPFIVLGK